MTDDSSQAPLVTLFAIPKPFHGNIEMIQRNAIASWCKLRPFVEVLLLGDEPGYAEIASEFNIRRIKEVECNEFGTPLLNSAFQVAEETASTELLCYLNADIILTDKFLSAVKAAKDKWARFLLVGRRLDVDIDMPINFQDEGWAGKLLSFAHKNGQLHPPWGIDYFVFPPGLWADVPRFAIGRVGFDNWLIYNARLCRIPVVNATNVNTVIHQNHDYGHLAGGETELRFGLEGRRNRELGGGDEYSFNISDANWSLASDGLKRARSFRYYWTQFVRSPVLMPKFYRFLDPIVRTVRWVKDKVMKTIKFPLTAVRETVRRFGHPDA